MKRLDQEFFFSCNLTLIFFFISILLKTNYHDYDMFYNNKAIYLYLVIQSPVVCCVLFLKLFSLFLFVSYQEYTYLLIILIRQQRFRII